MASIATATVKGGFFEQYGPTVSGMTTIGEGRFKIAQELAKRSNLPLREVIRALLGVAPGGTASKTYARVEANVELGGKRVIEQQTLINRATTAGDVTLITADLLTLSGKTTFGANPPANKDGNPLGTR